MSDGDTCAHCGSIEGDNALVVWDGGCTWCGENVDFE